MRGAWQPAGGLKDRLDDLLGRPDATSVPDPKDAAPDVEYWPNGEWQVYAYYGSNMTGPRAATTGSPDRRLDAYATRSADGRVRVLAGARSLTAGAYTVNITGLTAVGLPDAGSLAVRTIAFPFTGGSVERVDAPTDRGVRTVAYEGDALVLAFDAQDQTTAYAFEFDGAGAQPADASAGDAAAAAQSATTTTTSSSPAVTPGAPAAAAAVKGAAAAPGGGASSCRSRRGSRGRGWFCRNAR